MKNILIRIAIALAGALTAVVVLVISKEPNIWPLIIFLAAITLPFVIRKSAEKNEKPIKEMSDKNTRYAGLEGFLGGLFIGAMMIILGVALIMLIPIIGLFFGPALIIAGVIMPIVMLSARKGECPYCGGVIMSTMGKKVRSEVCPTCKKRVLVKDGIITKIPD